MASYRFSALRDLLNFDQSSSSAADVSALASPIRIEVPSMTPANGSLFSAASFIGDSWRGDFYGHGGNDSSDGGGSDTIDFSAIVRAVLGVLSTATASGGASAWIARIVNTVGGASNDIHTGDASDDVLIGDAGSNFLSGGAGNDRLESGGSEPPPLTAVTDTLAGGLGNDTYVLHRNVGTYANARVVISDSGGIDTVIAHSGLWTLGAGLENLTLGFDWTSEGEARGTGNALNNVITGFQGWWVNNQLQGMDGNDSLRGGSGADTLTGGAGADSFIFGASGPDQITDFAPDSDQLVFDNAFFTALGSEGEWAAGDGRFRAGAGATSGADANDRIIYNTSSGALYYDPDGSGAAASQLVATLSTSPSLGADDIGVI